MTSSSPTAVRAPAGEANLHCLILQGRVGHRARRRDQNKRQEAVAGRQAHRLTDRRRGRDRHMLSHLPPPPPPSASIYIHTYIHTSVLVHPYSYTRSVPPADPTPCPAATHNLTPTASRRSTRVAPSRVESSTTTDRPIAAWARALLTALPAKKRAGTVVIHNGVERAGPLDRSVPRLNRLLTTSSNSRRHSHDDTHCISAPRTLAIAPR